MKKIDRITIKDIRKLLDKIYKLFKKYSKEDWNGYNASPLKHLHYACLFVHKLNNYPKTLLKKLDIIPEPDGAICFEWWKSKKNFMSVSVKEDELLYCYTIQGKHKYGETNFEGINLVFNTLKEGNF